MRDSGGLGVLLFGRRYGNISGMSDTPAEEAQANTDEKPEFKPPEHENRLLLEEDDNALDAVYVTLLQTEGIDVRIVANVKKAISQELK
jgi:hypothetical protein